MASDSPSAKELITTFDKFKNVQFYKVNKQVDAAPTNQEIPEWSSCNNLKYITHKEMEQKLYN